MDCRKIIHKLKSDHFVEIINKGKWFERVSIMYAKEIRQNIFLLFVIIKDSDSENMRALIAHFESVESIGIREPHQILFYLSIKNETDLHYLKRYLKTGKNELTTS